jgi:protein-tyrosine-phosphatase
MKKILFVCIENSCRSQIAEGLANHFGKGILQAYSAGSRPSGEVNANAIQVMQEINIDISSAKSKGFEQLPIRQFDYVITLGCRDICPFVPANKHIEWRIENPAGENIDFFRTVRDKIKFQVKGLIRELSDTEVSIEGGK